MCNPTQCSGAILDKFGVVGANKQKLGATLITPHIRLKKREPHEESINKEEMEPFCHH